MLLALTEYETGLLAVAAVFISFALTVALVIPRTRPEFPGRRLRIFLLVCVSLFAAQMTAVIVLAELGEGEGAAHETTSTEPTTTEPTTTEPAAGASDAVGKEVFVSIASPSCGGCHTLADAGTSGTVGPNLDASKPTAEKVVDRVTNGRGVMPSFKGSLSEEQIQEVAAYLSSVAGG